MYIGKVPMYKDSKATSTLANDAVSVHIPIVFPKGSFQDLQDTFCPLQIGSGVFSGNCIPLRLIAYQQR